MRLYGNIRNTATVAKGEVKKTGRKERFQQWWHVGEKPEWTVPRGGGGLQRTACKSANSTKGVTRRHWAPAKGMNEHKRKECLDGWYAWRRCQWSSAEKANWGTEWTRRSRRRKFYRYLQNRIGWKTLRKARRNTLSKLKKKTALVISQKKALKNRNMELRRLVFVLRNDCGRSGTHRENPCFCLWTPVKNPMNVPSFSLSGHFMLVVFSCEEEEWFLRHSRCECCPCHRRLGTGYTTAPPSQRTWNDKTKTKDVDRRRWAEASGWGKCGLGT